MEAYRLHDAVKVDKGVSRPTSDALALESHVSIRFPGQTVIRVTATPDHLAELALGLLFERDVIHEMHEVASTDISWDQERRRWLVDVKPSSAWAEAREGVAEEREPSTTRFSGESIVKAGRQMRSVQTLFEKTGASHAAALVEEDGSLLLVREDIARHNALAKLVGAVLMQKNDMKRHFVFLSSRCSEDLMRSCIRLGVQLVVVVSAVTTAAVDLAESAGITLCGFSRELRFTIYTHPNRILGQDA